MDHQADTAVSDLVQRKDVSVARMGIKVLIGFELLSFGTDRIVFPDVPYMALGHVAMIIACLSTLYLSRRHEKWLLLMNTPIVVPFFMTYALILLRDLHRPVSDPSVVKSLLTTCIVGVFVIILSPQSRPRPIALLAAFFSTVVTAMLLSVEQGLQLALIAVLGFWGAFAWKFSQIGGRWDAAKLEIANRTLAVAAEKERFQVEMSLASDIQDSMKPSPSFWHGPIKVDSYMVKHGGVGGDWFSSQVRADGTLMLLVVDAVGKGLQAALVVHAVQSIWAATKSSALFDPKAWIVQVNDVLLAMGEGATHSVTLALAEVTRDQLIYWSAGHCPAYLRREGAGKPQVTTIFGSGPMLGISQSADLLIKPTVIKLAPGSKETLFLATDGVFAGALRHDLPTIEKFCDGSGKRGETLLNEIAIDDDKTLVVIELLPVANLVAVA